MATASVMTVQPIPGLHRSLTEEDMKKSATLYNGLPQIHTAMQISQEHVKNIVGVIDRHGLRGRLGIHLVHKHDSIPNGKVNLEKKLETMDGKWIKPVPIDSVKLESIHGVMFKFEPEENRLIPYEFAEGPSPVSLNDNVVNCAKDFIDYVCKNNLFNEIALQLLDPVHDQPKECTAEVEVDRYGTIVLAMSMIKAEKFIPTGWPDNTTPPSDPPKPGPGEHWAPVKVKDKETHRVYVDRAENEEELLEELFRQGVIVKV